MDISEDKPVTDKQDVPTQFAQHNPAQDFKMIRNMAAPPEIRLKRFLHYGNEEAVYVPCFKSLQPEKLKSIEALINSGKAVDPVNHIIKAHMDGYVAQKDALLFALATCAKQTLSVPLKEAAYSAVKKICVTSKDLFLFIKYMRDLGDKMNTAKHVVISYVMRGLDETMNQFGNEKEAQPILSYLQAVKEIKNSNDIVVATRLLESHSLSSDHVSTGGCLIKTREIWLSLIPTLSPQRLLDYLQSLSIRGFLKGNTALVRRYCEALNNPTAIAESGIKPARVFIELRTYELRAKEKVDMAVKLNLEWAIKRSAAAPKINPRVVEAIHKLFNSSFKMLVPTGLRYLVAVDTRDKMWITRCWRSRYVTLGEAAVLIALNLIKTELDVIFGTFSRLQNLFTPVPASKDATMINLTERAKSSNVAGAAAAQSLPPAVRNVFTWAESNNKMIDVFIILGDNTLQVDGVAPMLMQYRRKLELPNAKIITCSLNGPLKRSREVQGNGQLCVFGFDEHTPRVIEAFARGAF